MSAPSRVSQILADVATTDAGAGSLALRLCRRVAGVLPVQGAGLSVITSRGPQGVLAATDRPARQLEEAQFTTGEGPCLDALRLGHPVLTPDLLSPMAPFWPGFGPAAAAAGVRAVFAFPLQVGAVRIGALDLYRTSPGSLDGPQLSEALAYADAATLLVLHMQDGSEAGGYDPTLSSTLDARSVVHQATGMLSVQLAVPIDEALLRLRAHAYAAGRSLSEVSADLVARRLRFRADGSGEPTSHPTGEPT